MTSPTIRGFYAFQTFSVFGFGIYLPVWMLYLSGKGFDMTDLALQISILGLVQLAAEIPTGIVADRFSRRASVAIGQVLLAVRMILVIRADSFTELALASALNGLGLAFSSGATSALLFDALKAEGRDEDFQRIYGTGLSIGTLATVIGAATAGVLIPQFGLVAVLWISGAAHLLGGLIALTIPEPPFLTASRQQQGRATFAQVMGEYGRHLASSVRIVHGSTALKALFVMQAILILPPAFTQHYYTQPYLTTFGYSAAQISYVYTFLCLVQAALSKYSVAIRTALATEQRTYAAITALVLIGVVVMAHAPTGLVIIAGLAVTRIAMGLISPTLQESLNRRLDSGQRASCLSLATMGQSLLMALCFPFFGHIADTWSVRTSLLVLEAVFIPLLLLTWFAGRWLRAQKEGPC